MKTTELQELAEKLSALAVFRQLLDDSVVAELRAYLTALEKGERRTAVSAYGAFVSALYHANGGDLTRHIREICGNSENVYVRLTGAGQTPAPYLREAAKRELQLLSRVAALTAAELTEPLGNSDFFAEFASAQTDLQAFYEERVANIGKYGYGQYACHRMFHVDEAGKIRAVEHPDDITADMLIGYETERQQVFDNTKALLAGRPAANLLLSGDAGTGKSSTVKAVGNALFGEGLRIIEIRRDQLTVLPRIMDELAPNPLKFILFIDDLSFAAGDENLSAFKAVLEGSVSARPRNTVIYATSNRRHIVQERFSDREGDEIHRNDTMQELLSLSARFGRNIRFEKPNKATYLAIVKALAERAGLCVEEEKLALLAERFALERGGRSARLARQVVDHLLAAQQ